MSGKTETTRTSLTVATEQETDGRWIADMENLRGCLAYGVTKQEAIARCLLLASRILLDREDHDE